METIPSTCIAYRQHIEHPDMRRRDRKDPYNLRKTRLSEGDFIRVSGRSRTHYAPSEVFVDQVRSSRDFVPLYKGDKHHSWCPPTTEFYRYEDEETGSGSIVHVIQESTVPAWERYKHSGFQMNGLVVESLADAWNRFKI